MSHRAECGCLVTDWNDAGVQKLLVVSGTVAEYCSDHQRQRYKPGLTPRGETMPQTIAEWKHLGDLYDKSSQAATNTINKLNNTINGLRQKNEKCRVTIRELKEAAKKIPSQDDLLERNAMLVGELSAASSLIADFQTRVEKLLCTINRQ